MSNVVLGLNKVNELYVLSTTKQILMDWYIQDKKNYLK